MDLQDFQPVFQRWAIDDDATVKAACAQQGRVQDLGTVGGSNDDDAGGAVKAVHLGQQLI